jgi:spermidine synthase
VWLGSQHAQQLIILLSALSGLLVLSTGSPEESTARSPIASTVVIIIAAAIAGLLSRTVHPLPGIFAAYGRYTATRLGQADVIYMGEGWNATIAVTRLPGGVLNYHNAGKVQASSEPQDMRLQRMLGHLTTLVPAQAKKVLVIGCGAGVTAGAVSIDPVVEHQTIAEIEPLVPKVVAREFGDYNFHVVDNPKVHVRIDDARHFLLTTSERFDAVTSDPLDPWVKGAAMLYTREFFDLVKRRLNPGGEVTLFVQLYESNTEAVKSEIATFMEAFPNGVVWGNTNNGAGYDLVLLGQVANTRIDVDAIQARLRRPEYAPVVQSMREIGMNSAVDLFSTFAGRANDLAPWLADASINRDRNLRLQFLAGLGLNLYQSDTIYAGMLAYVHRFPDELFAGSPETINALRAGIMREQGR